MTKKNFIKRQKYIYTLGLTNLDLMLELSGGDLRIVFQIFFKKILKLKFSK